MMKPQKICVMCDRPVSQQELDKGEAYEHNGIVKHLDCDDNLLKLHLHCPIHTKEPLKLLYSKANGDMVYACPICSMSKKWWRMKQIRAWN